MNDVLRAYTATRKVEFINLHVKTQQVRYDSAV